MDSFYYDIFSKLPAGTDQYEGTIHFYRPDLTYDQMMEEASMEKNYPILPTKQDVRFVQQGSREWYRIMDTFR